MRRKRSSSGETLVETLAALLLVVLSGMLFLQMTMASTRMSAQSKEMDALYQKVLVAAEEETETDAIPDVTEQGLNPEIDVGGHLYSVEYYAYDDLDAPMGIRLISYSAISAPEGGE